MKKIIFLSLGCISLCLGILGVVLPILPSVPFFMLSLYCFSRSSKRLHDWFISTKLYKKHLENYSKGKGMTLSTKLRIIITVTILMSIGFILMKKVVIGRIILGLVWLFHVVYFSFFVKTLKNADTITNNEI